MSEFVPASFTDLLRQMYGELRVNGAVFGLPRRKWYIPAPDELDHSVRFHNQIAGNPSGPAAGPHTQLAQNLLLSYIAGGRMLEFKTVQVNDELEISRPCIDMATIGFNVEWSQELRIDQTIREYIAGMMLIEILRNDPFFAGEALVGTAGSVVFDMSVGYSLEGVRSYRLQEFFDAMRDPSKIVEEYRQKIPTDFAVARELPFPAKISSTVTLSTFHGCPADEIEKICEFLIAERDLNVIVKMNPPMLGKERLEHLLHDVMGYRHIQVNPGAYDNGLSFEDAVQMTARLSSFARQRGRCFGCKFSNTLEVLNDARVFGEENRTQYLSGPPLHVITMTLTEMFRNAVGAQVPISFSAGIDAKNFADVVACGFVPVTTCSDLLKPGGYGRLPPYLKALSDSMRSVGAASVDEFILKQAGVTDRAQAELINTTRAAEKAREDLRYRFAANSRPPKRVESQLVTFDCLTCDKCIPVCPNAANFVYHTAPVAFDFFDILVAADGSWKFDDTARQFVVEEPCQIANFADFCNACGNCDTFCPEYGGPFIRKPQFFSSMDTWKRARPRDGFAVSIHDGVKQIVGRIMGREFALAHRDNHYIFADDCARVVIDASDDHVLSVDALHSNHNLHKVDWGIVMTMKILLNGITDLSHVTPVNARWMARG